MKFFRHIPFMGRHFKCVYSEKQQEKSSIVWRILWHEDEVAAHRTLKQNGGQLWSTVAITGGPWQAEQGLMSQCVTPSSWAPQLINHQGRAWGARSLKPSITTQGGRQSRAHFHVLLFPPPPPTFNSQIKVHRWPGKHWMETKVASGCNQMRW